MEIAKGQKWKRKKDGQIVHIQWVGPDDVGFFMPGAGMRQVLINGQWPRGREITSHTATFLKRYEPCEEKEGERK